MSTLKIILNSLILLTVYSCGNAGQENAFIQNTNENQSNTTDITNIENSNTGIDLFDIDPGLVCTNGGINILTFVDVNNDYTYQIEETLLKSKSICHGLNGTNGTNATTDLETIPAGVQCPNGGVKISSGQAAPVYVCHGQNGAQGAQGLQGIQGLQGLQGTPGTNGTQVIPIKFCTNDNSAFPEYGLKIGNELFGVLWGTSPASPNVSQAYFAKLTPGQYMSTGGNGCIFTVP